MKNILFICILLIAICHNASAELSDTDLEKINNYITASEARTREYIDLKIDGLEGKFSARIDGLEGKLSARIDGLEKNLTTQIEGVEKQVDNARIYVIALIALIGVAVLLPQYIVTRQDRQKTEKDQKIEQQDQKIEELTRQIQALQEQVSN